MTELLYYQNQYLREIQAKVVEVRGGKVSLEKTIFIPQTSTELGDSGAIDKIRILGSQKDGDKIWHIIPEPVTFQPSDIVKLELDWDNRLKGMRLHSALHLLAGPFDKVFAKRAVAGAVKDGQAYIVFKEELLDDVVNKALDQANTDIEKGLEIKSYWDQVRQGFRWTQVGEYPPIPDGGLHVRSTSEIGQMRLVSKSSEKGKYKVTITI